MFKTLMRFALLTLAGIAVPASAVQPPDRQDERRQGGQAQEERRRQDPPPPPPVRQDDRGAARQDDRRGGDVQDDRREPSQAYRVKNVLGAKVSIQGDISIGTVDDIVFNDEGYVEYLIVNNDGQLRTVPWAAAKFNFERRTATVNISQSQYQTVPTYTAERYPTFFAPAYRSEVYRFYGITPRDMRRMERRDR